MAQSSKKTKKSAKTAPIAVSPPEADVVSRPALRNLRTWNIRLAAIHALQGIIILLLSDVRTFPVYANFLTLDTMRASGQDISLAPASQQVADINLAYLVALFFFLSAAAHLVIATVFRRRYEADLLAHLNRFRWIEYALSASTMMVAIGVLVGIYDITSMLMLFSLTAVMNLLGLVMEFHNRATERPRWVSYIVGCIAGIVPWLVIALYLMYGALYGATAPTFVYVIFGTIFVAFMSFAVVMYLQYRKIGRWQDYLHGERSYMILSLVAKTALAWQVFAGALRP